MTKENIMNMFKEANKKHEHLVNITGIGNWVCPAYFLENSKNFIVVENPKDILKMNFCPFCGERLYQNTVEQGY